MELQQLILDIMKASYRLNLHFSPRYFDILAITCNCLVALAHISFICLAKCKPLTVQIRRNWTGFQSEFPCWRQWEANWHSCQSITMTSQWPRWRLKSPASRLFTQPFIKTQIKENFKAPRHWPLCREFTGTGEFPAQRASYAENVAIWWRHHAMENKYTWNLDRWIGLHLICCEPINFNGGKMFKT